MANVITKTRTNYVSITDTDKFNEIIHSCVADDEFSIIEKQIDGETKYGFYINADIDGLRDNSECDKSCAECDDLEDCEYDFNYDDFLKALQTVIAPGDALIITTISYLKMIELHAYVEVVTADAIKSINLESGAMALAQEMLGNKDWSTINNG